MAGQAALRQQAQAEAYLHVAPQLAALANAVQQAKTDRNSALHAATSAYHLTSGVIHAAGPQVRHIYSDAARSTKSTDAIAKQGLSSLASSPGVDVIKAASAREGGVGGAIIARQQAEHLAALSDRRIEAAAGQAFQKQKTLSDYATQVSKNNQTAQSIAATQGAAADASLGKLTQAQEDRSLKRDMQATSIASNEKIAGERLASSAHLAALGRRSKAEQGALGRKNARDIANIRASGSGSANSKLTPAGAPKLTPNEVKGRTAVMDVVRQYGAHGWAPGKQGKTSLTSIANDARSHGVNEAYLGAGADLATKGYVTPQNAQRLKDIGVSIPKEWAGVQVPAHTRKRPQVFKP